MTSGRFAPPREGEKDRIDWVLFRGAIKCAECETVLYNEQGRYPSDHYPVLTCLALGNTHP